MGADYRIRATVATAAGKFRISISSSDSGIRRRLAIRDGEHGAVPKPSKKRAAMINHTSDGLFSFAKKANYWNDLYTRPSSLFEHFMCQRRDYAADYIRARFDTRVSLLDLGCGAGVLSEKLLEYGYRVTAADASADMVALCEERLRRFPVESHRHCQANCLDLPFADGEFDVIVSLGMFGYFDEVTQALREIRRVLKPGGTLIVSVRNRNTFQVFDLFQLAKHPLRPLRAIRHWWQGLVSPGKQAEEVPMLRPGDDGFRVEIYQSPGRLIEGFCQRGFTLADFAGLGYGPVTFAGRKLFSERFAIRLSDFLNRAFEKLRLQPISRWFADVSFYVFERRAGP
jgi:2-polyprenyl-3-methyl-5-hydroxy-6-metoxy-1,4-benzoquinol methylase